MNLTREEAASFLNKLATDSKPLLVFTTGSWGFSLFIGSIVHLDATHLIINQNRDVLIPVIVFLEKIHAMVINNTAPTGKRIQAQMLDSPPHVTAVGATQKVLPIRMPENIDKSTAIFCSPDIYSSRYITLAVLPLAPSGNFPIFSTPIVH